MTSKNVKWVGEKDYIEGNLKIIKQPARGCVQTQGVMCVLLLSLYLCCFSSSCFCFFLGNWEKGNCKGWWVLSTSFRNSGTSCSPRMYIPSNPPLSPPLEKGPWHFFLSRGVSLSLYAFPQGKFFVSLWSRVRRLKAEEKYLKMLFVTKMLWIPDGGGRGGEETCKDAFNS